MNIARKCTTLISIPFLSTSSLSLFSQISRKSQILLNNPNIRHASKFRAAVLKEFGKPLAIEELKRPSLKKGQVRLRVYCCGINTVDFHNVAGNVEPKPELPFVPGFEVCGEILEVTSDEKEKRLRPGERAIALHSELKGGFAEEIVISSKDVWIVDNFMSYENGASLIISYVTALLALTRRAEVKEGDTVLVNGAAGRVGLAVVDLAANVYRCKVIAVCHDSHRADVVRDRGAFATIVMSKQDLCSEVNKITDGKGVKIIIDTVGGDLFKEIVKCAAEEAKIVVAGYASRKASKIITEITQEELMENSFSIIGVSLDQYRKKQPEVYRQSIETVIEMHKEKLIKPHKAKHFPLESVNEALQTLKDKNSIGKYVLDIP